MTGNSRHIQTNEDCLSLENELVESILDSPAKKLPIRNASSHNRQASTIQASRANAPPTAQREANLRQELVNVRKVNEAIEGVIDSLEKVKSNIKNVNQTVNNASTLLNIWTRILSQAEHNQRLILDPTWQGGNRDIIDMEDEAQAKQEAAQQREAEEQERRAEATRKAEEEEKRRTEATLAPVKPKIGTRGRGNLSRGTSTGRAGYVAMGGATGSGTTGTNRGSSSTRRTTSGIGRGTISRGLRGRG